MAGSRLPNQYRFKAWKRGADRQVLVGGVIGAIAALALILWVLAHI